MPSSDAERTQVAVIGAGPGGYAAAFHAADLGLKVALVEAQRQPGGVCLHRGCIPSKALLHVAAVLDEAHAARKCGISFDEPDVDVAKLRKWKSEVVRNLAGGLRQLIKRRGLTWIQARARFTDSHTLALESTGNGAPESLRFEHAIIATGSVPVVPGNLKVDDPRVMDSSAALELEEIPKTLLVVGGGYIGLELGTVYAALGTKVTVVELTGNLLPGVDEDLVKPLQQRVKRLFDRIYLSTNVEKLEPREEGIVAHLSGQGVDPERTFDRVLISVGRRPNTEKLGLENTDVALDDRGFINVDRRGRSNDATILAIGDAAGEPMLAHKATRQGKVAVEALAGEPAEFDNAAIPAVVFTDPEIAWCGLTETQAAAQGIEVQVARYPWVASGRARTLNRTEGLTKLIVEPDSQRILGVGLVGAGAGELIAEGVLAVEMAATARDLAETIHAHPTLSETLGECAERIFGQATHLYEPRQK